MRIVARIALVGLGLLPTGMMVRGQTPDAPTATSQSQQKDPNGEQITAVPNRPTFASTAEMVQLGVFEIEYGFEAGKGHQNVNGLLKWGAVKNLELWFLNNPIQRDDGTAGLGDSGAGFKYKLFPQGKARPTLSVLYVATLPTARPELGNGAMAHLAQILVSKDFGKHHFDVNEGVQFLGRPQLGGFDRRYFTALSYSHPVSGKWGYTGEIAGFSRQNASTQATMTLLNAATYNLSPRLVLDGGAYIAVYGQLPRVTAFAGLTYSVANLYHLHSRPASPTN
jgi:Putative MetA-pathway of phenol degradation